MSGIAPHPAPQPEASATPIRSPLVSTLELFEGIVKIVGVLAAFGYISLRTQLNHLGIPFTSSLGIEGYLRETYVLLAGLLDSLFVTGGLIVVLAIAGVCLFFAVSIGSRFIRLPENTRQWLSAKTQMLRNPVFTPSIMLIIVLRFYLWMMRTISGYWQKGDLTVGALHADKLQSNVDSAPYNYLIWVCLITYIVYRYAVPRKQSQLSPILIASTPTRDHGGYSYAISGVLWRSLGFALVVLALHIPFLDGLTRRGTNFRQVAVYTESTGASPVCGLLVLRTAADFILWQARNGTGLVDIIPAARVQSVLTGPIEDVLVLSRKAAENSSKASFPACPAFTEDLSNTVGNSVPGTVFGKQASDSRKETQKQIKE